MRIRFNEGANRLEVHFAGANDGPGAFFERVKSFDFPSEPEAFGRQCRVAIDGDGFVREVVVTGLDSILKEFLGPKARDHIKRGTKA